MDGFVCTPLSHSSSAPWGDWQAGQGVAFPLDSVEPALALGEAVQSPSCRVAELDRILGLLTPAMAGGPVTVCVWISDRLCLFIPNLANLLFCFADFPIDLL